MSLKEDLRERQQAFFEWLDDPSDPAKRRALEAALERVDLTLERLLAEALSVVADPPASLDAAPLRPADELAAVDKMLDSIAGEEADNWDDQGLSWLLRLRATQARLREEIESRPRQSTRGGHDHRRGGGPEIEAARRRLETLRWGAPAARTPGPDQDSEDVGGGGRRGPGTEPAGSADSDDLGDAEATRGPEWSTGQIVPVKRTPHLGLGTERVMPGTSLMVTVWADTEGAHAGEVTEDVTIHASVSIERFDLKVWLVTSEHFEVIATADEPLTIVRSEFRSNDLQFGVRVKTAEQLSKLREDGELANLDRGFLRAIFHYEGQPSGKVTRRVEIGATASAGRPADVAESASLPSAMVVSAGAKRPDLLVQIEADPDEPGRRFSCLVSTPHVPVDEADRIGKWVLSERAADLVASYMREFTAKGKENPQRRAALKGAGKELWLALPKNVKDIYWRLVDQGKPPKTVSIVTEEPCFPWELVVPYRRTSGRPETREPLGVEAAVGRWIGRDGVSARQNIALHDSLVVAPDYQGRRKLKHAAEEAQKVAELFPGRTLQPVSFDTLDQALKDKAVSLLHFACHGKGEDPAQAIFLDDEKSLSSTEVRGMEGFESALGTAGPLIFLNACEVGRLEPALSGVGGFASTFIDLGAGGVVAALWSVKDTVAHEVAMAFYNELEEHPGTPFAEVLRRLRARAYEGSTAGEDSFGAYCFYGDPFATRA